MAKLNKNRWIKLFLGVCLVLLVFTLFSLIKDEIGGSKEILRFVNHNDVPQFKKRPSQNSQNLVKSALKHDKWIVVTTVANPTVDVKYLASIPGWKVVVVGDTKTPRNWSHPNCVFLDIDTQESLGLSITSKLPYRSYARKNVGYLYAIAHGAKYIYETDDDNRPLDKLSGFQYNKKTSGLMFAGQKLFNPYRHFGQSTLWPRGYPLSAIGKDEEKYYYRAKPWNTPMIQDGVSSCSPVTATSNEKGSVDFDKAAPPAFLPEGTFSPISFQNTLLHQEAFWALYLSEEASFGVRENWHSYWAQRLLWEIGGCVGFYHIQCQKSKIDDPKHIDKTSNTSTHSIEDIIAFLSLWNCPTNLGFFQCVHTLSKDLAMNGLWSSKDVEKIQRWLSDLLSVGYTEPKRIETTPPFTSTHDINTDRFWSKSMFEYLKTEHPVTFSPSQCHSKPTLHYCDKNRAHTHVELLSHVCPKINVDPSSLKPNSHFDDVLLIVIFNHPHYEYIQHLEAFHRPIFPNMIYCGENAAEFEKKTKSLPNRPSFIEVPIWEGLHGYNCTLAVLEMGYNVTGYFIIGDDDLVFTWHLKELDKNLIWRTRMTRYMNLYDDKTNVDWWIRDRGSYRKAYEDLDRITSVPEGVLSVSTFKKNVMKNARGKLAFHGESDMYYIPRHLADDFHFYASHFAHYGPFLELVIPVVHFGINPDMGHIIILNGFNLWGGHSRDDPWLNYTPETSLFLHPIKLSNVTNRNNVCNKYFPTLIKSYWD